MSLKVSTSNKAIARSGHLNTLDQLRQSDIGGFGSIRISTNVTPRVINNVNYIVGSDNDSKPQPIVSSDAYLEYARLIKLLGDGKIDYITIYSEDQSLLFDQFYSTKRALLNDSERALAQSAHDDLIIISRNSANQLFITWGSKAVRRTAGVGVKVEYRDLIKYNNLYGALYKVLDSAYDNDYIDVDVSTALNDEALVIVQGHAIKENKYTLVAIEEFAGETAPYSELQEVTQPTEIKEETSKMKTTLSAVLAENKAAAINAGEMETGRLVVNRIVAVVKKRAPMMIKGYIDTPVGRIAVANLFATLVREYMPDNALAGRAADGAVKSAAYEVLRDIDIPAMIEEVLAGFKEAEPVTEKVAI